ncbi:hydroxymethylglutaryl-CoA synthase [Secundilactobacillus paracollinoides]|uniref:Hydroxymethylglutaryl-CoA synthase n=1 Tax=Secundilactobacillus paracollinoides TaxID=240427 RepID=A0A1B2J0A7_9LACO|nr:hydroxymethylglutaryl-CoA synthase [Secundilactobacillus paracollinoides]ANZ61846.1 hydroxymethylglutaryl-CoA synthase [Secundilactobacillus paracollinoides]ANZ63484.1 hydroxymethylglutaryl-CoA synthase [Secundilactobacillus paracollinoides]ANZ67766.1 hydroxymethylglutaryl-CoA synthase [Secundilactobacillus paracollinoides]KRL75755.1 3-hydroxy-3-methylglutaryl-CoA synthase [Secundilactobacillus paracollinoides DSM 15502 = JCM 11969]
MQVGIDQIGFYAPNQYLDLTALAQARNEDPNKYLIGIGQSEQVVIPVTQDVVTMAASAASQIITDDNRDKIAMVIFGTESGIDHSKSAAMYVKRLLQLPDQIRAIEVKQACYGATFGVQTAKDFVRANPDKQVLVIGADIARYGLNTPGEVTQGGGAVAMTIAADPQILALDDATSFRSEDVMDFWRPLYRTEALVDGRYSENIYVDFFKAVFHDYCAQTGRTIADFTALTYHLPFTKMGLKGLRAVLPEASEQQQAILKANFEASRAYNRRVGNLYTGSLYLSLISLLANAELTAGDRIGLFSYGSGAEGEFYSGTLVQDTPQLNLRNWFDAYFKQRRECSVAAYEQQFQQQLPAHDVLLDTRADDARFVLTGIRHDQRQYVDRQA